MGMSMTAPISAFARAYHSQQRGMKAFNDTAAWAMLGDDYEMVAGHMKNMAAFFDPRFRRAAHMLKLRRTSPSPAGWSA